MGNKMFGFVAAAILILGIALNPSPINRKDAAETVIERVLNNTVVIHACVGEEISIGSGVIYENNGKMFVLTAAHVIGDGKGFYLISQTNPDNELMVETWQANVIAYETNSDWAILQPVGDTWRIRVGTTFMSLSPRVGDGVYACGSPLGEENTLSEGIIANRNRIVPWNSDKHFMVTCNGTHGSSGGGIFDVNTGKCIGIVVRTNRLSNMLYVVPIKTIINDLEQSGQLSLFPT